MDMVVEVLRHILSYSSDSIPMDRGRPDCIAGCPRVLLWYVQSV